MILGSCLLAFAWPFAAMHQREVLAAGGGTLSDTLHKVLGVVTVFLFLVTVGFGAAAFGRAAQVDSPNPATRYDLAVAYLRRGAAFADSGASDRARADFERVLRLRRDTALAGYARDQLRALRPHRNR